MLLRTFIIAIISVLATPQLSTQEVISLIQTRGTGQTTGHIITLSVRNNTGQTVEIAPEVFYLPSNGRYQSYVGRIPGGITIPPGATLDIPASGYCTDIHTPPVPQNTPTLPGEDYVTVGSPRSPSDEMVSIFPNTPIPPFQPEAIPQLTNSPGYWPTRPDPEATYVPTWPVSDPDDNSSIPMGGTIDPDRNPQEFGPVIVAIVQEIERTSTTMQADGMLTTPFSGNPAAELDAVIQQTTWLVIGLVTGESYNQDDFAQNVYEQFTNHTGTPVSSLPEEDKERLDNGVEDFWGTFTAVGLEAKVISQPQDEVPPSAPIPVSVPETETEDGGCDYEMTGEITPPFDFEMEIAEEWGDAEERQEIKDQVAESLSQDINVGKEEAFVAYDISSNPTSSTAFWKGGHIGGFASAYAKAYLGREDGSSQWVWGTHRMDTQANGTMEFTMAYSHDETCRAMVAGTALIRVKATSSAFDAMAGNSEGENATDQIDFVWWTRFAGVEATNWLAARGRGKTTKTFREHMMGEVRDQVEGDISAALEAELLAQAEQHLHGVLEELGLGDLNLADLELPDFELPDIKDLIEEATGIEIPDLEAWISDGIEAAWNLPFVANTYATANGILSVQVGGSKAKAQAKTSVYYQREGAEETADAMRWSGDDCQESFASDAQADALTIRTVGHSNMVAEAVSKFGFGNGHADATLESMNLQILTGICICPAQRMTDATTFELSVEGYIGWYTADDSQQEALQDALEPFLDQLQTDLTEELNGLSRNALENLSTDQFEGMVADKVKEWAENHPFAWRNCGE